jgi:hypothetical protein
MSFSCKICNYTTQVKCNYIKHLKTKKHLKRVKDSKHCTPCNTIAEQMSTNEHEMSINEHKLDKSINSINKYKNEQIMSTNEQIMSTNEHKISTNEQSINKSINQENPINYEVIDESNIHECIYCAKIFKSKANKRRHELHYCKEKNNTNDTELLNELQQKNKDIENLWKEHKMDKEKMYKQMEKMLEKVGDTINHNTITQNIVLNSYGQEDLSHITEQMLDSLLKGPNKMIQNLTRMIHFNKEKPENMNIYIPNRKDKYVKVFKNGKWVLEEKKERIPDMIDKNYNILDNHYENLGQTKLTKNENNAYSYFQSKYDDSDQELKDQLYNDCELVIINK